MGEHEFNESRNCESSTEIDKFVSDLEVSLYVTNQQLDFNLYNKEPTFSINRYLGSTLLHKDKVHIDNLSL